MKWLIILLTAATGLFHLLYGLGIGLFGNDTLNWVLLLNGVGYLVLLWLFATANGPRRNTIRWILLAYTLITLIGYFVLNGSGAWQFTTGLIIKAIELLLIILLFLDRGSDRVAVATPAPAARASAKISSEAYQSAAGAGVASSAAAVGAVRAIDQADARADAGWIAPAAEVPTSAESAAADVEAAIARAEADTSAWGEAVVENAAAGVGAETVAVDAEMGRATPVDIEVVAPDAERPDWLETTGEGLSGAAAGVGAALVGAAAWVGDRAEDAGEAAGEAVDETGEALDDAGDWVGDRVEDVGQAAGGAVDATGAALAGAAAWVGDKVDDMGDALTGADDTAMAAGTLDMEQRAVEPTAAELRAELEAYLRSFGSSSEFRKGVEYVEGIGPAYGDKLRGAGVVTVLDLMVEGATRIGRKHLSDRSGISASQILTWVNHIDLYRIKGVAEEYADLLEQSGVDTVVELAQRNPKNLFKRMIDINDQKQLVRRTPHLTDVQSWVEQAKELKRLVHY